MTATTDRSPDVQHMRDQQARTRALLASFKPIADEDEDTVPGTPEDAGPEDLTLPMPTGSKETRR